MPDSTLDDLIARLLAEPACSLSPATRLIAMPDSLPADVRQFFKTFAGGSLYYHPDHVTPQFGCKLHHPGEQPVAGVLPCYGVIFNSLYIVADFPTGEHEHALVSAGSGTCGHIYHLHYSLGNPTLTYSNVHFLAHSFTRWLAMHVEAWDVYRRDWREGLNHFRRLIEHERDSQ